MSQLYCTDPFLHGFSDAQGKALEKLLAQIFPIDVAETRTVKGNLSTKALTAAVAMRLGSLGFEQPRPVGLPGTSNGLEPDFLRRAAGELGGIAGELQFALRECVPYYFLKHAKLQRMGFCATSIEVVPASGLARDFTNACATFEWARTVLEHLVLPVQDLRIALVGVELRAGASGAVGAGAETTGQVAQRAGG